MYTYEDLEDIKEGLKNRLNNYNRMVKSGILTYQEAIEGLNNDFKLWKVANELQQIKLMNK
jgi:hypothetical protein